MSENSEDQIHPATPARQEIARRDGDFAKSLELAAAVQMLGALLVAYLLFGPLATWVQQATIKIWSRPLFRNENRLAESCEQVQELIFSSILVVAPIGLLLIGCGLASHWCQTGPTFLASKPVPDLHRLAPTHWFQRVFSLSAMATLIVGLPKSILAIGVMVASCWFNRQSFLELGRLPGDQIVGAIFQLVLMISSHVAGTLLIGSILDYGFKYLGFQQRIRMTDQQLRDEARMQNGNPSRPRPNTRR